MSSDIGVKLTGDNSEFRSMMADSVEKGDGYAGQLAEKVGHKLYGLREVSHVVANALGLNLEHIAENIARWYTGMSKEEEDAYKKSESLSTQAADAAIKNMRARLTEEQKYQLAIQERDKLQAEIANTEARTGKELEKLNERKLEMEGKISEIIAYEAKQAAERTKAFEAEVNSRFAASEAMGKAQRETLSLVEREKILRDDIAAAQAMINSGQLNENELARSKALLTQREAELQQVTTKEHEQQTKLLEKKAQLTFEALPIEEKILTTQQTIETLVREIAVAKKKHVDHDEDDVMLLEAQANLGKYLKEQADERARAEKKVTAELHQQTLEITKQVNQKYGRADKDLSDRELAEKVGNLKQQLQDARNANDSGAFFFEQKLKETEFEIGRRFAFRSDYARKGAAALLDYSAFDEQTLRNYIRPEDQQIQAQNAQALREINQRLQSSGLFPLNGRPPG